MIGSMNERVILQAPKKLPNGQGGFKLDKANPVVMGEYWAGVEVLANAEAFKYRGIHSEAQLRITARKNNMVNNECQIVWQGKVYEVKAVVPLKEKPGYIYIDAGEAVK